MTERTCLARNLRPEEFCHIIGSCLPGEIRGHRFRKSREGQGAKGGTNIFDLFKIMGPSQREDGALPRGAGR